MKKLRGFALMEAAISVMIMGIVLTVCTTQFNSLMSYMRLWTTNNNHHVIACALATYFEEHRRLPEPEDKRGEYGMVPFRQLRIMEKFTYDGYGNKILYATQSQEYPDAFFVIRSENKNGKVICVNWYSFDNFKRIFGIQEANHTFYFHPTIVNHDRDNTMVDSDVGNTIRVME